MSNDYLYRKTVKGRPYIYFRSPVDQKLTPLPADETSIDFKRQHQALLRSIGKQKVTPTSDVPPVLRSVPTTGTLGQAIIRYKASTDYLKNKPKTRLGYDRTLLVLNDRLGAGLLCDLDTDALDAHSEDMAKEFGFSVADRHVSMIVNIWDCVKKYPEFALKGKANPATDAVRRYSVKQPNKPWSADQQEKFMATAPDYLKLGKLLLHFSAQRGGDCVKMLWTQFDGKGIWVTPEKSDAHPDPLPNYHLCPKPLLDALNSTPRVADTILTNSLGQPWSSADVFARALRKHLIKIGLAKRGEKTISMHGLRKNAASEVAQLLVGTAGIKSVTGHKSGSMADYYGQHANKVAMNAAVVAKWNDALEANAKASQRKRAGIRRVK